VGQQANFKSPLNLLFKGLFVLLFSNCFQSFQYKLNLQSEEVYFYKLIFCCQKK
jgi:hypothetical protein